MQLVPVLKKKTVVADQQVNRDASSTAALVVAAVGVTRTAARGLTEI